MRPITHLRLSIAFAFALSNYVLLMVSGAICTFTSYYVFTAANKAPCTFITLQDMFVPPGKTLDLSKVSAGTTITFAGKTTFGYQVWGGPLIYASGPITVTGARGHVINAGGAGWWDYKGDFGKKKPITFSAYQMHDAKITWLNIINTPAQVFSIFDCHRLFVDHITIDNTAGFKQGALNTDGFDVGSSTNVTISNSNVVNQDDCLAVNSGSDIYFRGNTCSGGHGISVGSVGGRSVNTVDGVYVSDSYVINSENGVRVKTIVDATGFVNNVHFTNIHLTNIYQYGIAIEQDYHGGTPSGRPTGGVPITGLHIWDVTGTVTARATQVYIVCAVRACRGWDWGRIKIIGGTRTSACQNIPPSGFC